MYADRLGIGIAKFIIAVLFFILNWILKYYLNREVKSNILDSIFDRDRDPAKKYLGILFCCMCCGLFVWQIVDLIMFGINKYDDGNGVPLASW